MMHPDTIQPGYKTRPWWLLRRIFVYFGIVILIWGFNWPMNKIGIESIPSLWHAAIRLAMGCVSLFTLLILSGKLVIPQRRELPIILVNGLLQIGLFTACINTGLQYVDAGRSAILVYTVPLWTTPIATLFFKEKLSLMKFMGLMIGLMGILTLLSPMSIDWSEPGILFGHGVLLLAAIAFAIAICLTRHLKSDLSPLQLLPWQLLVGTIPAFIYAAICDPHPEFDFNPRALAALSYTGILATGVAYWLITIVNRRLNAITVSMGLLGVPFTGVISAALILGEPITLNMKIAMMLIFSGLIVMLAGNRLMKTLLKVLT
jgi:drug/metabolite transporter (DMT)-like permease